MATEQEAINLSFGELKLSAGEKIQDPLRWGILSS